MNEREWRLLEDKPALETITINGVERRAGSRVRIRPRPGGDIMDVALAGKIGVVESIEQDYDGKLQAGVVMEDDPGRDLGLLRQPGHRFFFAPEELEAV
jgi:hypothetical protein